ncbi:hypothetical protein EYF80_027286 [Liparis tanakae]|uniref:Uncharacterized protein n=1 Tax=Liparis tanakae TaxID=230148 RepID=A0A4Z2HBV1_9TELE|nr:hypothetical protein EYF80_027286 [Liparis tanakae]
MEGTVAAVHPRQYLLKSNPPLNVCLQPRGRKGNGNKYMQHRCISRLVLPSTGGNKNQVDCEGRRDEEMNKVTLHTLNGHGSRTGGSSWRAMPCTQDAQKTLPEVVVEDLVDRPCGLSNNSKFTTR